MQQHRVQKYLFLFGFSPLDMYTIFFSNNFANVLLYIPPLWLLPIENMRWCNTCNNELCME